jgi:oligoribonuclease NrnB/cAMP/cGMP phosphodiesterase (DHH superfamily)
MNQNLAQIKSNQALIIFHGPGCTDGLFAAWCFWRIFKYDAEYHMGVYQNGIYPNVKDRIVYMVDFCYPLDIFKRICDEAKHVYLIDHHASALAPINWDLANFSPDKFSHNNLFCHCSLEKSGAMLAWEFTEKYFRLPNQRALSAPKLIKHVQDRDLWKFELEFTKEILSGIFSYDLTFEQIDEWIFDDDLAVTDLWREGVTLQRAHLKQVKQIMDNNIRHIVLDNYTVPLVNTPHMYASDIGNILSKASPFAVMYQDTAYHREFSLRSNKENPDWVDVSKIAIKYGGGGHVHASGFKVDRNHPLAKV